MAIRVSLHHTSHYRYDRPVSLSPHVIRLRPAPHCRTPISAYSLRVAPAEHFINWQQDPFGNHQARLVFPKPTTTLEVEVDLIADLTTINPFDFFLDEYAEIFPFVYEPVLRQELAPYLGGVASGPRFAALVEQIRCDVLRPRMRSVDLLVALNQVVQGKLRYDIRMEAGVFPPEETLSRGHGSCRDFAWLLVHLLRQLGLAARFVSGYSIQLRPDVKPLTGPAGVEADVTDLHAWAEAYLPGAGWIGLDATSGLLCGEGHIPLACTAEPASAAPITGAFAWLDRDAPKQGGERFGHEMWVKRLDDPPRPTKPYDDRTWAAILACGDAVEAALQRQDVRLTMGGEPTFVALGDPDNPEWSTAALGPTKARVGDQLLRRLQTRFAPGAVLSHGQGKWYPGEPLPRWAYACTFRKDGQPIWHDPTLFAGDAPSGATEAEARVFALALGRRLGVEVALVQPAYEDVFYYLWRERRLPANVDPFDSRLDDEIERARLCRIFEQGLGATVGFALPLREEPAPGDDFLWKTGPWSLRDPRLYLIPGDSPMGFRLPLDSLPWSEPGEEVKNYERDPFAPRPPLPAAERSHQTPGTPPDVSSPDGLLPRGRSAGDVVRSALCIEPRNGTLHVFFPPTYTAEAYLDLVTKVEATARELRQRVRLEGYPAPHDDRLQRLSVTPDPGVLEVNVHPAHSWRELVAHTTIVYEEAKRTGLGAEKFMLDGRHTGTGGGNHLTLGGPTPADSPLLRRPDLLRSLVGYWLNHPALSYLFSGLFIGPTSQAPRVDEARHDSLYELEIAFRQLANRPEGAPTPPWLVDRLFRNLLIDVTGNTHRTEHSIDKLFSPDSASGRQGLLELRAFEMPPDPRMSCSQQLLVRALFAWFWSEPYTRPAIRWGTGLVDRFLLPHYVGKDFGDVVGDLRRAGFGLERSWFDPHFEFRFPRLGQVVVDEVEIELRQALEPWHVMGEEAAAGGTARYVDSSVERLQVKLRGAIHPRHLLVCNGRRVPLSPTEVREELVGGVRYRAWQPGSSLHPTIGVHAPLIFDLVDTWSGRSLGGCTYHVTHPGGRAHDRLPANALEAESRRAARFWPFGHTPGPMEVAPAEDNPELPHTLDLRRSPARE